jgi:hypothetical protein
VKKKIGSPLFFTNPFCGMHAWAFFLLQAKSLGITSRKRESLGNQPDNEYFNALINPYP